MTKTHKQDMIFQRLTKDLNANRTSRNSVRRSMLRKIAGCNKAPSIETGVGENCIEKMDQHKLLLSKVLFPLLVVKIMMENTMSSFLGGSFFESKIIEDCSLTYATVATGL